MNIDDLDRFIRAYGYPYGGARTFIGNSKVQIEDIEKSKNEPARHGAPCITSCSVAGYRQFRR